jgi:hypothetical protein
MMTLRVVLYRAAALLALLATGCGSEIPTPDGSEQPPQITATTFDPAKAGVVTGRVTWTGPIPHPPGFLYGVPRPDGKGFEFRTAENPNRPQIDPESRSVAGAVVFLRGIDPAMVKPWDLPPVAVAVGGGRIVVVQGGRHGRVGFARRGDTVTVSSTEDVYHVLRGRGDAFFSLTLPARNDPVPRTLNASGRVELSSGTGLYWARADLFVSEHPYFTLTDADGRFTLDGVPGGEAEVVVWLPGWQPVRQERDPDSTSVARQAYGPPVEKAVVVTIEPTRTTEVRLSVP